jgi:hypothetical protein
MSWSGMKPTRKTAEEFLNHCAPASRLIYENLVQVEFFKPGKDLPG